MSDAYVTKAAWLHWTGRRDLIDEIADQFERPVAEDRAAVRTAWPRVRGPRTTELRHAVTIEVRLAG